MICWVRLICFDNFSDDFVENYFQWSELDEEDTDIKDTDIKHTDIKDTDIEDTGKPEANNPEHLEDSEGNEGVQDSARTAEVKIEQPSHARRDEVSTVEDDMKKSDVESGSSKETKVSLSDSMKSPEDSIIDGKESSSSTHEDIEYHIKHGECHTILCQIISHYTIPYHAIPYHTIPYHTIP
jgi:hypothetical protein